MTTTLPTNGSNLGGKQSTLRVSSERTGVAPALRSVFRHVPTRYSAYSMLETSREPCRRRPRLHTQAIAPALPVTKLAETCLVACSLRSPTCAAARADQPNRASG